MADKSFNQRLKDGEIEVQELIENLRRFPQTGKVKIQRDLISIQCPDGRKDAATNPRETLHWLHDEYEYYPYPED